MDLLTPVTGMQAGDKPIVLSSQVFLSGSCFATRIGEKLAYYEINSLVNPMGVIFHPIALVDIYKRALENRPFELSDIFEHRGLWHSYQAHSSLSQSSSATLLDAINKALDQIRLDRERIYSLGTLRRTLFRQQRIKQMQLSSLLLKWVLITSAFMITTWCEKLPLLENLKKDLLL